MRAKNEYKFIEEAYTQVNEGFDDVGKGHVHRAAARGARPRNPDETALGKAFLASQTAEGPPNPGPDDLGPDKSEEQHETHKPYVSSYIPFHRDEDDKLKPSKKIWAVLNKDGTAIFTSNDKDEAYKWFDDNFKRLRDEDDEYGEEYDEESYWKPEGLEEGRRVTYKTSRGNQSTGKVLKIHQDVVEIRDELAGEEKEILIKDILKVESELGEGPEVPSDHPLGKRSDWS